MQTLKTLFVEFVPFFEVFESFSFIFNNKMSMSCRERIPYVNLFVYNDKKNGVAMLKRFQQKRHGVTVDAE